MLGEVGSGIGTPRIVPQWSSEMHPKCGEERQPDIFFSILAHFLFQLRTLSAGWKRSLTRLASEEPDAADVRVRTPAFRGGGRRRARQTDRAARPIASVLPLALRLLSHLSRLSAGTAGRRRPPSFHPFATSLFLPAIAAGRAKAEQTAQSPRSPRPATRVCEPKKSTDRCCKPQRPCQRRSAAKSEFPFFSSSASSALPLCPEHAFVPKSGSICRTCPSTRFGKKGLVGDESRKGSGALQARQPRSVDRLDRLLFYLCCPGKAVASDFVALSGMNGLADVAVCVSRGRLASNPFFRTTLLSEHGSTEMAKTPKSFFAFFSSPMAAIDSARAFSTEANVCRRIDGFMLSLRTTASGRVVALLSQFTRAPLVDLMTAFHARRPDRPSPHAPRPTPPCLCPAVEIAETPHWMWACTRSRFARFLSSAPFLRRLQTPHRSSFVRTLLQLS